MGALEQRLAELEGREALAGSPLVVAGAQEEAREGEAFVEAALGAGQQAVAALELGALLQGPCE